MIPTFVGRQDGFGTSRSQKILADRPWGRATTEGLLFSVMQPRSTTSTVQNVDFTSTEYILRPSPTTCAGPCRLRRNTASQPDCQEGSLLSPLHWFALAFEMTTQYGPMGEGKGLLADGAHLAGRVCGLLQQKSAPSAAHHGSLTRNSKGRGRVRSDHFTLATVPHRAFPEMTAPQDPASAAGHHGVQAL